MTPVHIRAENWLESMAVASTESPPHRRMVRPLRQKVDLKFVREPEVDSTGIDPALYDLAGRSAARASRPGRLLNERV